ncbi:MAG: glycerol-3-phosphate 1-O-acyltransferase PlsY [Rickettsiales bacterium]|nr:glycerol-3-phosphate 1-O-acyltransferase PlsY [Rickettsiales bacterium]
MIYAILFIISYLLGSIPVGFLLVRAMGKGDIRKVSSGSTGATNVARVGGLSAFIATWILDMAKSAAAVAIGAYFISPAFGAWCGFVAIVGHCYPVWLGFKGGKGNSSMFGTVLAVSPISFCVIGLEWLLVAISTGYSSAGAIVGFLVLAFLGFAISAPMGFAFMAIAAICLWRHKDNIQRLINGTESKMQMSPKKLALALLGAGLVLALAVAVFGFVV